MLAAKDMQQSAQLTLLEAAVHAPLPSPSLPHAVPIGSSAQPGSILLEEAAVAITVVRLASVLLPCCSHPLLLVTAAV
jgi:hypothetical protein